MVAFRSDSADGRAARIALAALLLLVLGLPAAPARAQDRGDPGDRAAFRARAARLRAVMDVKRRRAAELMALPDVVGTGTGLGADGEPEIRVFTVRSGVALPARLEGVRVRPRTTGRFYARRGATCEASGDGICATAERWPLPVPIGVSVGHPAITAGTIGARVTDGVDVYVLSNNHVLANSNQSSIGDAALQPGPFDGGSEAAGDSIGTLDDFEPILFCPVFPICPDTNFYDAAIALTTTAELGASTPTGEHGSVVGYGAPNPLIHPAFGDPAVLGDEDLLQLLGAGVQKVGRTTGHTTGSIATVGVLANICYDPPGCSLVAQFDDQISIPGAFSDGGDSGSLIVTDDALLHPVALLFAGSDTETLASPIDRVLLRFGVGIDDGGATVPVTDAEVTGVVAPAFAIVNQTTTVSVDVRNAGNQPLPAFDVVFHDDTEVTSSSLTAPALAPGASARLDFAWTPAQTGSHDLRAVLQISDDDPGNDAGTAQAPVLLQPPPLTFELWSGTVRTDTWTQVNLAVDYGTEMVVVCTPQYDVTALGPMVARVRNAAGTGFQVGLGRPWFGAFPGDHGSADVDCLVVRDGVYSASIVSPRMEAVRIDGFTAKDDSAGWSGQARSYAQSYTAPVVIGQVISPATDIPGELGVWSNFWARGASPTDPPSPTALYVGRHTAEDPTARGPETLAYIVVEAGPGWMGTKAIVAGVGPDILGGVDDAPPYAYPLSSLKGASHALASSAGMDGVEGGWPILYGTNALTRFTLGLAIEEDWWFDPERSHPSEQAGWIVFGSRGGSCGIGFELVLLAPFLARLQRRRRGARRVSA